MPWGARPGPTRVAGVVTALTGVWLVAMGAAGCTRGCGSDRTLGGIVPPIGSLTPPLRGTDCPDGLARCEAGTVSVSRLATIPDPCRSGPACQCPWDVVEQCPRACVADGVEIVVDRTRAARQLCAPTAGAPVAVPLPAPAPATGSPAAVPSASAGARPAPSPAAPASASADVSPSPGARSPDARLAPGAAPGEAPACDEGDRYRCAKGDVFDCEAGVAIGRCLSGCFAEDTSIDDDGVSREAAFAILCLR